MLGIYGTTLKNSLNKFIGIPDIAKKRISVLEDRSI